MSEKTFRFILFWEVREFSSGFPSVVGKTWIFFRIFLVENRDLFSKIAPEKESEKKNHMFVVEENERLIDLLGSMNCFSSIAKRWSVSKDLRFES